MQLDELEIKVAGLTQRGWMEYDIDSDMLVAADGWRAKLALPSIEVPKDVVPGAQVEARFGGEVILKGRLDERVITVSRGQHELALSGRDNAGILLDCSAPIFTAEFATLQQIAAKIVSDLGIVNPTISGEASLLREKVSTEPGDSAWDMLRRAAEANGRWPWFEPNGTLVIGGPRYDLPPVGLLTLRADGVGNNVLSISERRSMVERFSQVTVYGQSPGSGTGEASNQGRNNIKATEFDDGVGYYRPKVVTDHEATSVEIAKARAKQIIGEARLKSYEIRVEVKGHRSDQGVLWSPGQRVALKSEPHGLDGIYFVMGRRFYCGRGTGQRTQLVLKEDGVWVPEAHPSRRKHRRGINSMPGRIVDLTTGVPQ
jgi:prophage tail gpP-like protein